MLENKLTVSSSPHLKGPATTKSIMLDVVIALLPALVAAVIIFGFQALLLTAVCVVSCVGFEYLFALVTKRAQTISDLSAVVTGVLLAFNLPATLPVWMAVAGSFVAIVIVKQLFGGIGQNFVNPALCARIVLTISFPMQMTTWAVPFSGMWIKQADMVTGATPLGVLPSVLEGAADPSALPPLLDMFLGVRGGCLGETCAVALLLGGVYLIVRRVITPVIPLCYIGTVFAFTALAGAMPLYQILSGGLILGAVYMATDYTTSPLTVRGQILFAIGCGLITCLIRLFGSMNEGVSFSILLMNILVPYIDRFTRTRAFGALKPQKSKA